MDALRIAGYILSGGKGRRMDGENKLFLQYNGVCFYKYICMALRIFPVVYLSVADGGEMLYQGLSLPTVADKYPGIGPMGGIYSGLLECPEEALFITACDTPLIEKETVEQVTQEYNKRRNRELIRSVSGTAGVLTEGEKNKILVVQTGERVHPLFGIYPKSVLPVMEEMISEGNYRMLDLLVRAGADILALDSGNKVEINVNTKEEYQKLCGQNWADKAGCG